jgi:hypothetical protein
MRWYVARVNQLQAAHHPLDARSNSVVDEPLLSLGPSYFLS